MSDARFDGRVALVTGGARGIGRATCLQLAEGGARVAINFRSSAEAADETRQLIESAGGQAITLPGDVSSSEDVERMVEQCVDQLGAVELLVNNAGIFEMMSHAETTLDVWKRHLDINLTGTYLVTWAVKEEMVRRGFGRIVNVASIAGIRARPQSIAYAASKAGVISLTKSLAQAVADDNIRVNALAPGLIDTEMISIVEDEVRDSVIAATPISRLGTPAEMANAICFLLSEESSFITGQTLVASGGRVLLP